MPAGLLLGFVIGYFILLLIVAWYTSRNANNESFFIGNRNSNWMLVAFGMIGTSLSGALRKAVGDEEELVSISAADPLNLAGIVTPGEKVPAFSGNRVLYRNGVPVAVQAGEDIRFLQAVESKSEWEIRNLLIRKQRPGSYVESGMSGH